MGEPSEQEESRDVALVETEIHAKGVGCTQRKRGERIGRKILHEDAYVENRTGAPVGDNKNAKV
jgi:hypothetical protein